MSCIAQTRFSTKRVNKFHWQPTRLKYVRIHWKKASKNRGALIKVSCLRWTNIHVTHSSHLTSEPLIVVFNAGSTLSITLRCLINKAGVLSISLFFPIPQSLLGILPHLLTSEFRRIMVLTFVSYFHKLYLRSHMSEKTE